MAIGVIARLKVQPGKNEEFEGIFAELEAAVRANEPGNNFYSLHKSRADENDYIVLEQYADQDALNAHGQTDQRPQQVQITPVNSYEVYLHLFRIL